MHKAAPQVRALQVCLLLSAKLAPCLKVPVLQASSPAAARLGLLFAQSKWLLGEHRLCKAGRTDDLKILFSLMGISSSFDEHYATKFAVTAHICKVSHSCCPLERVFMSGLSHVCSQQLSAIMATFVHVTGCRSSSLNPTRMQRN